MTRSQLRAAAVKVEAEVGSRGLGMGCRLGRTLQVGGYLPHPAPCTPHPVPFTLNPKPCTLHPKPLTLNQKGPEGVPAAAIAPKP